MPAGDIEKLVVRRVADWLLNRSATTAIVATAGIGSSYDLAERLADAGDGLAHGRESERRRLLLLINAAVALGVGGVAIRFDVAPMLDDGPAAGMPVELTIEAKLARRGHELRIVLPPRERAEHPQTDAKLVALLAKAELAYDELGGAAAIDAARRPHLIRLARLKFLAPDITAAILEGRQPPWMTARSLLRASALSLAWANQRIELGFA